MFNLKKIGKILPYITLPVQIKVYKFNDKTKTIVKHQRFPKVKPQNASIVNLFAFHNHCFVIKNIRKLQKIFSIDDVKMIENNNDEISNLPSNCEQVKIKSKAKGFTKYDKKNYHYFWDCETHLNENKVHTPYAVGYVSYTDVKENKSSKIFYGYDCFDKFIDDLKTLNEQQQMKHDNYCKYLMESTTDKKLLNQKLFNTKESFTITFWSHNGGRYDHFFLLSKLFDVENVVKNNGILYIKALQFVQFKDFMRHCNSSLSQLCNDFELSEEFKKTEFPHEFVNFTKDIYYKGQVPASEFWPNKSIPDYIDCNVLFDLEQISRKYLNLDCVSLAYCFEKYCSLMCQVTTDINDRKKMCYDPSLFLTAPAFSYTFMKSFLAKHNIHVIKNTVIDKFIRKSLRGGRCFVQKGKFESSKYGTMKKWNNMTDDQKKEFYNSISDDDCLVDFDAVSLYPSAMCLFKYPVGKAKVIPECDFGRIMKSINELSYDKHCIVECDIEFDQEKCKNCCTPLLAIRQSDGSSVFSFCNITKDVFTNVDIQEAIKYNYAKITKIYNCIEWENSEFIFKDFINGLFNKRLEAKKNKQLALSNVLKIIMNSSYGKTTMKFNDEYMKITKDNNEFDQYIIKGELKGFSMINKEAVLLSLKCEQSDKHIKHPVQLGCFITAYSKVIMNNCIQKFNGFSDWNQTFYYTDTDSMQIKRSILKYLEQQHIEYNGQQISIVGESMGQLHDDLGLKNSKIIKSYYIRPKCYILEYIGLNSKGLIERHYHVRSKGVNSKYLDQFDKTKLMKQYEKMLNGKSTKYEKIERFKRNWQNKHGCFNITTVEEIKTINQAMWTGRKYDECTSYWIPFYDNSEDHIEKVMNELEQLDKKLKKKLHSTTLKFEKINLN